MATPSVPDSGNVFPSMVEVHGHPQRDGYLPLTISTARGPIEARLYEAPEPLAGVVLVGGAYEPADGDWFDGLGRSLALKGIAVLWTALRDPSPSADAEHDVLAGCRVLLDLGVERLGLVGRLEAGATVIRAAAWEPETRAIVTVPTPPPDSAAYQPGIALLDVADQGPESQKQVSEWLAEHLSS